MHWNLPLAFTVTPKSGPLRQMQDLLDANRALTHDLPKEYLQGPHWWKAGWLVFQAAESGDDEDIWQATNEIANALDAQGWMNPVPRLENVLALAPE